MRTVLTKRFKMEREEEPRTGELQGSDMYKLILYKDGTRAIIYEHVPGSKDEYEYGLMIMTFDT